MSDMATSVEQALRDSEERLRHIVEDAQDLIYYCDAQGRFTYVNPAAERVMEYNREELLGRHFLTLVRPDYREAVSGVYAEQARNLVPNTYFEFPAMTKTGGYVWVGQHVQLVHEGGHVVAVHAIARDITRQKETEERLRLSEAQHRSLIDGAIFGIYRASADGRILDANPALVEMLGYESLADLQTHNMADLYQTPADRTALLERFRGQEHGASDLRWKRKDGKPILVRLTARTVEPGPGEETCFETIAEDVTERRALEEQLRQAQKMEAVGLLARGVAHDFNNVLAAIMGCSELIALRSEAGQEVRDNAEEIRRAAVRGAALTRQLLTFSRSQTLEKQVVDLHAVLRNAHNMLRRLVGDGVSLEIRLKGRPPSVRVEPGQFDQVLMNLVTNARDATPDGGTIEVTADAFSLDAPDAVRHPGLLPGRYARVAVRDTGCGIDPADQAHVFEPFFSTKDPSKGTGLGLSIVYGIAKDSGGVVAFSTAPGKGTTFEFILPMLA